MFLIAILDSVYLNEKKHTPRCYRESISGCQLENSSASPFPAASLSKRVDKSQHYKNN